MRKCFAFSHRFCYTTCMMSLFKRLFLRSSATGEAALFLGLFALLSQLLGLLRDRLLASSVGVGSELDIYYAAFKVPDLLYTTVATLAGVTVLLPYLQERFSGDDGTVKTRQFLSQVFSGLLIFLTGISIVLWICMPLLARIIAPGFPPESIHTLVSVSRIMLIQPILIGISNMFGSVSQLLRKFFTLSLAPVLYNVGIIVGIIVLYPRFGLYGLAYGVLLGAVLHVLTSIPVLVHGKLLPVFTVHIDMSMLRNIAMVSIPRTLGLSLNYVTMVVVTAAATMMGSGTLSVITMMYNIFTVPVNLIGVSLATASFSILVAKKTAGDTNGFINEVQKTIQKIVFYGLPILALFIILRFEIITVLLGRRSFTPEQFILSGSLLVLFLFSFLFQSVSHVYIRSFYALARTSLALRITALAEGFTILGLTALMYLYSAGIPAPLTTNIFSGSATYIVWIPIIFTLGNILKTYLFHKKFSELHVTAVIPASEPESRGITSITYIQKPLIVFMGVVLLSLMTYFVLSMVTFPGITSTTLQAFLRGSIAGGAGIAGYGVWLWMNKSL
jgi:putative peptidoglycan lipid II flippase